MNKPTIVDDRLPPIPLRGAEYRFCLRCDEGFIAIDADPYCGEGCATADEEVEATDTRDSPIPKPSCQHCGNDRQIDLVVRYAGHYWHECENRWACSARIDARREIAP